MTPWYGGQELHKFNRMELNKLEIRLSRHNWGDEDDPKSSNGGCPGTSTYTCNNCARSPRGLVWYTNGSKTNEVTGAGV